MRWGMAEWGSRRTRIRERAPMKVREVLRLLRQDGWFLVATRGSHRQFKHASKPGRVTISGGLGEEMPKGTLASVLRQAGLKGGEH